MRLDWPGEGFFLEGTTVAKFPTHRVTVADICNGWHDDNSPYWEELDDADTEDLRELQDRIDNLEAEADEADDDRQTVRDRIIAEQDAAEARFLTAHENDLYDVTQSDCCISDRSAHGHFYSGDQIFRKVK